MPEMCQNFETPETNTTMIMNEHFQICYISLNTMNQQINANVSIQQHKVKNSAPFSQLSRLCFFTRTNNNITECFHMLVLGTFGIWLERVTLDKNSLLQGARRYHFLATHSIRPILTLRGEPPVRIVLLLPLLDNLSFFFNDRFLKLKLPGPRRVGLFEQERLTQAWSWVDLNNLASFWVFKNTYVFLLLAVFFVN